MRNAACSLECCAVLLIVHVLRNTGLLLVLGDANGQCYLHTVLTYVLIAYLDQMDRMAACPLRSLPPRLNLVRLSPCASSFPYLCSLSLGGC